MKYIRSCESCHSEIRFPIDKGTLFVTCPYCKHTFRVDPDDPVLYSNGRFDIIKKNNKYPEEFFFNQERIEPFYTATQRSKNFLKKFIVILLFTLLFSHLYKIYNSETIQKDENHDSPEIKTEDKENSEYDI